MKINISKSGSGDSEDPSKGIDGLTKVMKDFVGIFKKGSKLGLSGIGGGGAGGGFGARAIAAAGTTGTVAAMIASMLGLQGDTSGVTTPGNVRAQGNFGASDFDKILTEAGEEMIVKTDTKTGAILEVMTMREAKEKGIVDKLGNISDGLDIQDGKFEDITEGLEDYKGSILVTDEVMKSLKGENEDAYTLMKEINAKLKTYRDSIPNKFKKRNSSEADANFSTEQGSFYVPPPTFSNTPNFSSLSGSEIFIPPPPIPGVNFTPMDGQEVQSYE